MTAILKNKNYLAVGLMISSLCGGSPVWAKAKATGDSGVEKELRFRENDEAGNEVKALKTEMLVMRSEKEALTQIQRLEERYRGTRMEPEILVRLAELYMRRARTERFFEVHKTSETVLSFAPTLVKEASESAEIRRGIEIYSRIQEKFPTFRAMDVVMFNNAYAFEQIGDFAAAEKLFTGLISKFAGSPLVPDSLLAVGEINYNRRAFAVALESFKAIRKYPEARVYPYGIYKAAWSYYNMSDAASGMRQLEDVVAFGRQVAAQKLDSKLDLRKEALGDLALFFGDVEKSVTAVDYLNAQAKELDSAPYILRLVELYKRHSRYNDVEIVLNDVLAKMPKSAMVATAHEELIWNYERTKNQPKAAAQLAMLDKYCTDLPAPVPVKANKQDSKKPAVALRKDCQDTVAETSKKLATKWHALWKKQGGLEGGKDQPLLLANAETAYRVYLKSVDQAKDADLGSIHYSYAELLFARGEYREASVNYALIGGYRSIDAKVAHDAAYAATVALERAVSDKWNDQDEKQLRLLSSIYIERFPKGNFVTELRFKRAFIAYEKERYEEAAPQFKSIGWSKDQTPANQDRITKSQDLYLDILNIRKDFAGLKLATKELLAGGVGEKRGAQMTKIYREAYFAEIQVLEEKGDLNGPIEAYKKFALENALAELAPKAW